MGQAGSGSTVGVRRDVDQPDARVAERSCPSSPGPVRPWALAIFPSFKRMCQNMLLRPHGRSITLAAPQPPTDERQSMTLVCGLVGTRVESSACMDHASGLDRRAWRHRPRGCSALGAPHRLADLSLLRSREGACRALPGAGHVSVPGLRHSHWESQSCICPTPGPVLW